MKRIAFILATIVILSSILVSCTKKAETTPVQIEVARFIEDTTTTSKLEKFKIVPYAFKDIKNIKTKNLWVTKNFLEDKEHLKAISDMLENDENILIQDYNITASDVYSLFNIAEDKRMMKTSKNDELADVKQPLQRYGVVMFKLNSMYYALGANSQDKGSIEALMAPFELDKSKENPNFYK